jgi:hypothetical protein
MFEVRNTCVTREKNMQLTRGWIVGAALCAAVGCGSEPEAPTVAVAQAPVETAAPVEPPPTVQVVAPEPQHGGTVVMAGTYPVEVTPHRSGQVYAYVLGEAPPPDQVELTVEVPVVGRSTGRPVRLVWSPARRRYEGRVRRVEIVEGPIDVILVVGGVEHHGHVAVFVLFPAIDVVVVEQRRGKWKGKGKHRRGRIDIRIR